MKNRCYTKYSYVIYFVLAAILIFFSFGPMLLKTDDAMTTKVIWSTTMIFFSGLFCVIGIHNMQFFYFKNGHLIVKSAFGIVVKLDANNSVAYIEKLPTYSSWIVSIDEKWICVYEKSIANSTRHKFKSGCANKKKYQRVQIVYSAENKQIVEKFIKMETRKSFVDNIVN